MRIRSVIGMVAFCLAVHTSAQQPSITSFQPDGILTWTNMSTAGVAVIEKLSPATSGEWIVVHTQPVTAPMANAQVAMTNSGAWFRVANTNDSAALSGMVLIPGGSNSGTNPLGAGESYDSCWYPATYSLSVGSFYMDRYEVTNDEMVRVMQWAYDQGRISATSATVRNLQGNQQELLDLDDADCRINWNGSSFTLEPLKGSGYPCVEVSWYGAAAYCNYRSQMEGRTPCYDFSDWSCNLSGGGYRLPTSEEWEYAARGGAVSRRFPWGGDTISHDQANYSSRWSGGVRYYSYDNATVSGHHPSYDSGGYPYTSPVGSFAANAYGLYDLAGNVREWCSDWHPCYVGLSRVICGGSWDFYALYCRVGFRGYRSPDGSDSRYGFRAVLPPGQ